ncbi:MAG TPA: hypothetical protein VGP38_05080 [Rubrobacter sp.]|nr:hypothetical protein [Rubrobacter sp.]
MAANEAKLDRFDHLVPVEPWANPWQPDGTYLADEDLLARLLSVAVGTAQRSGIVAAAADVWAAEELRRAGFDVDEVWPRRVKPRVLPRDVRNFIEGGALGKKLREEVEARLTHDRARRALPAEAHVLGAAYSKQADVVVASWAAGVEVLISTKTMLSSYQKNLRNRFEEGYGDAKNLRGRHPLASLGFLFIVGADIPATGLEFAVDMLRKLVRESDVYECACLLVIDGTQGVEEDEGEDRAPEDEPSALVALKSQDGEDEEVEALSIEPIDPSSSTTVSIVPGLVPRDLAADIFFERLIKAALDRMPVAVYTTVRKRLQSVTNSEV